MTKQSRTLETAAEFFSYARAVQLNARCHAQSVDEILDNVIASALALPIAKIIARTNVAFITLESGRRLAFRYARERVPKAIEVRERTTRGEVLASFTNQTQPATVRKLFDDFAGRSGRVCACGRKAA